MKPKDRFKPLQQKSCEIDPMPTSLLKGCIDIVAPTIMEIINLLLTT